MKIDKNNLEKLLDEHKDLVIEALNSGIDRVDEMTLDGWSAEEVIDNYGIEVFNMWKLKEALTTKLKPVDMSVLAGSPIDCEFIDYNCDSAVYGFIKLERVIDNLYQTQGVALAARCKPRMNYPFSVELFGGECEAILIADRLMNAGFVVSIHSNSRFDCLAISITGVQENHCWPWECDK